MNVYIPPFAGREPAPHRRQSVVPDDARDPGLPPVWRVLADVHGMRLRRAAGQLAHAKRKMHRARVQERQEEAELAQLLDHANNVEGNCHASWRNRVAQGRDIHDGRAAQARLAARIEDQLQAFRACTQTTRQTLDLILEAQRQYRTVARKEARFQTILRHIQIGGLDR